MLHNAQVVPWVQSSIDVMCAALLELADSNVPEVYPAQIIDA
jgi:hypothetical protein